MPQLHILSHCPQSKPDYSGHFFRVMTVGHDVLEYLEVPGLQRYSSTRVRCTRARGGITAPPLQLVVNLKLTRNDGTQSEWP